MSLKRERPCITLSNKCYRVRRPDDEFTGNECVISNDVYSFQAL